MSKEMEDKLRRAALRLEAMTNAAILGELESYHNRMVMKNIEIGQEVYYIEPVAAEVVRLDGAKAYKASPSVVTGTVTGKRQFYLCNCDDPECCKLCGEDVELTISSMDDGEESFAHLVAGQLYVDTPTLEELHRCFNCCGWGQVRDFFTADVTAARTFQPTEVKHVECPYCKGRGFMDKDLSLKNEDELSALGKILKREFDEMAGDGTRRYL